ncbi:MAG TPA: flotillin domain-containing protein, partial [bacterium]|nr:flotillin domain-containing protein [bacterium]
AEAEIAASKAAADAAMGATKFQAEAQIAEQERNYQVKLAEYTAGVNKSKAEAELAYDLQRNITAQRVKEQEIQIQVIEKEKQLQVQQQEILRKEKELEATVLKPALAEQQRIQTLANAEKYQLEVTAQGASESAKLRGFAEAEIEKAQADARRVQGLIDAQIAEARGRAEAEALRAKGLAEAEVLLRSGEASAEAMRLKAQAWQEYNSAAILQLLIEKLPEMARAIAEPLSKTEKIVMINNGGGAGGGGMASQITKEVTDIMTQLPPVLEALTGMDMQELMAKLPALRESANGHTNGAANGTSEGAPGDGKREKAPIIRPVVPEPPIS